MVTTVQANLPGVRPEDIDVTIEDGILTIKAETKSEEERKEEGYVVRERRAGSFHRALRLSDHVDTDKVTPLRERWLVHHSAGGRIQESQASEGCRGRSPSRKQVTG